jgi:uncharacterized protein (DUF1697 family)
MTACRPMSPCCAGSTSAAATRVPVAALREVVLGVGHSEVATYIQSGNLGFTSEEADTARIAAALERAIAMHLGVRPRVVVLTRAELAQVVANNPFPDEPNPRWVHAIFRNGPLGPDELAAVAAAQQRARDEGSDDEARVVGTTLFLDAPRWPRPQRAGRPGRRESDLGLK